jgi:hypothetical protein
MSVLTGNTRCYSKAADKEDLALVLLWYKVWLCLYLWKDLIHKKKTKIGPPGKGFVRREEIVVTQGVGRGSKVHESFT